MKEQRPLCNISLMSVGRRYIIKSRPGGLFHRTISFRSIRTALCALRILTTATGYGQVRSTQGTVEKLFSTVAAEIAEDLVIDRVGFGGNLIGGDFLIPLFSQKDYLIIRLNL